MVILLLLLLCLDESLAIKRKRKTAPTIEKTPSFTEITVAKTTQRSVTPTEPERKQFSFTGLLR